MCIKANKFLLLTSLLFISQAYAQLNGQDRGYPDWYVRVKPYLWLSNLDTDETLQVGDGDHIVGDYYVPVGDSVLERSWALSLEVGKGRLRGIVNLSRANIKNPGRFYLFPEKETYIAGAYDLTWFTGEFLLSSQIGPFVSSHGFEIYVGVRYIHQKEDIKIEQVTEQAITATQSWLDPVIGARVFAELGERWWAMFHSDIGGFGVGIDFTWTLGGELGFRIAEPLDITMRYNFQEIQYDNEETGAGRFIWEDGVQQGWFFGFQLKL